MITVFLCYCIVLFIFLLELKSNGNTINKLTLRIAVAQKNPVLEKPNVFQSQNISPSFSACETFKYLQEHIVKKKAPIPRCPIAFSDSVYFLVWIIAST